MPFGKYIAACVIIVPDSRLQLPSRLTMELITCETASISVAFEDWLWCCIHRRFLIPPLLFRMQIIPEYLRIATSGPEYLDILQGKALVSDDDDDQELLQCSDVPSLFHAPFVLHPSHLGIEQNLVNTIHIHPSTLQPTYSSVYQLILTQGSLWREFSRRDWELNLSFEGYLISSALPLLQKSLGFWPAHPLASFSERGSPFYNGNAGSHDDAMKSTENWIEEMKSMMDFGTVNLIIFQ